MMKNKFSTAIDDKPACVGSSMIKNKNSHYRNHISTKLIRYLLVGIAAHMLLSSCTPLPTGITPSVAIPSPKPDATPISKNVYYVDSVLGSDANLGSPTKPWQTIGKAGSLISAGDTVMVLSGDYPERVDVGGSGLSFIAQGVVNMQGFEVTGNNNLIRGFTIQNPNNNSGLRVSGNFNIFEQNEISNTLQDGVWFFGHDNIFRHNYIHDIWLGAGTDTDPHVDCFQTWSWDWDTYNVLFEGNICNHNRASGSNQIAMISGDDSREVRDITFRNNIFIMHDAGYSPLAVYGDRYVSNIKVYNNTFYNTTGQGSPAVYMEDVIGSQVINNVSIGYSQIAELTGTGNLISNNTWDGEYGMVDYLHLDFHLLPNSPLIDAGVNTDAITDFDGIPRPQGNSFDIGAYEYTAP
jgi:hypothetical protein